MNKIFVQMFTGLGLQKQLEAVIFYTAQNIYTPPRQAKLTVKLFHGYYFFLHQRDKKQQAPQMIQASHPQNIKHASILRIRILDQVFIFCTVTCKELIHMILKLLEI
jgi:hypothetical protein